MLKTETKRVKHIFTADETAALNTGFRQAHRQVAVLESELDSVKSSYKVKVGEAEAKLEGIGAALDAGFELRDEECYVDYRHKDRIKAYYLKSEVDTGLAIYKDWEGVADAILRGKLKLEPIHTEPMTAEDYQVELVLAEAKFERKEELPLFIPAGEDMGLLIVGRLNGRWYTALRAVVGGKKLSERLDSEQAAVKKRPDAVAKAAKRFGDWLKETSGKEVAKGFESSLDELVTAHREREE